MLFEPQQKTRVVSGDCTGWELFGGLAQDSSERWTQDDEVLAQVSDCEHGEERDGIINIDDNEQKHSLNQRSFSCKLQGK